LLWSGSTGSVPAGWLLCDGTNGTPDLRDRFIIGAGNTYAVNATGGTADAVVVSHTHAATVTDPTHNHATSLFSGTGGGGTTGTNTKWSAENNNAGGPNSVNTTSVATGISVTNASAGVSGTGANIPPYYALAYIQKT
jgi:hypothetical protein